MKIDSKKELMRLLKLMDSLVNFDVYSSDEAKDHFLDLIYKWHGESQELMYQYRCGTLEFKD